MRLRRYRGRHLKLRPRRRGPVVVGTAAALWAAGPAAQAATHTVRAGETLWSIAQRYGTSVRSLARANGISNPNVVVIGTNLSIPGTGSVSSSGSGHTVQPGETLWSIAQRYGTTVDALARANGISNPNLVVAGTTLSVGSGSSTSSGMSAGGTHRVGAGETLSGIAARHGTTVEALARANNLSNPNVVIAGTDLSVPAGSVSTTSTTPSAASTTDIGTSLEQHAIGHGVDPSLIKAVAYQESGWQQDVVSSAGAIGVMQVMPGTARFINRVLNAGSLNVREADDNVHLGVMFLDYLLGVYGDERKALAAYYSGPDNVGSRLKGYQRQYVDSVQALKSRF